MYRPRRKREFSEWLFSGTAASSRFVKGDGAAATSQHGHERLMPLLNFGDHIYFHSIFVANKHILDLERVASQMNSIRPL
jgi:hypothetical protein